MLMAAEINRIASHADREDVVLCSWCGHGIEGRRGGIRLMDAVLHLCMEPRSPTMPSCWMQLAQGMTLSDEPRFMRQI